MPRRSTPGEDRWPSKSYAMGYVFNRGGTAVMRVKGRWRSTGLLFTKENRAKCLELLDKWIPVALRGQEMARSAEDVPLTVLALANEYVTLHARQLSPEVKKLTELAIRHYFADDCELSVQPIVRRINAINARGTTLRHRKIKGKMVTIEAPMRKTTLRKRLQYVGKIFRWAVQQEYLPNNPVDRIELGRAPKRPSPRVFTDDDLRRIFEWFERKDLEDNRPRELRLTSYRRYNLLWKFFLYTGCRSAEALSLTWSQVNESTITFEGKRERHDEPKRRGFPLEPFPELREILDELRASRSNRSDRVFDWWDTTQGISDAMRQCVRALGISGTVKTLRVTAGIRWRRVYGLSDRTIADLRGHTERVAELHYWPEQMASDLAEQIALERSKQRAAKVIDLEAHTVQEPGEAA